ncbi:hypothetical protein Aperf_G00000118467 [Anoplocephala perfoliata]
MIPKREIGALDFIKNNPEYDGRGVTIAIWDTGVDPTAHGLQVTSDGKPKIVDMIDASGSGDVPMLQTFKITDSARSITTLTGRNVSIPPSWKPLDGLIKIGVKSAAEIFPSILIDQLKSEETEKCWRSVIQNLCRYIHEASGSQTQQTINTAKSTILEASTYDSELNESAGENDQIDRVDRSSSSIFFSCKEVNEFEPSSETPRDESQSEVARISPSGSSFFSPSALPNFTSLQDWLASLDKTKHSSTLKSMERVLATLNENYEFTKPIFDCFLFKGEDGDFVACVDTSPYEDTPTTLAELPLLKDFSIDRQVAHFGNETLLYFTVKILNDGDLLQIVTNSGSHGTHVAAIAAAYFPLNTDTSNISFQSSQLLEDGNQNGIAPGAQIVSIKIAVTQLGGMETIPGLLTALNWTSKLDCDIINYSFGEKSFLPNFGRIHTHLSQFVTQTDVAFVTSAGNNGPSLGTVGSPGGSADGLIGVAPLLFPTMMEYMYVQPIWKNKKEVENSINSFEGSNNNRAGREASFSTSPVPSAYTWGSRGPTTDGGLGVTVSACGGAVADVAAWKRNVFDLLNGSSMSSPSVAGGLALRQSEFQPRLRVPFILWRAAIFACSKLISHLTPLEQGAGLFQVGETYEYLRDIIRYQPSPSCSVPANQVTPVRAPEVPSCISSITRVNRFYGWRLRCYVTGPGCIVENTKGLHSRGIWLRNGWLPTQFNGSRVPHPPKMLFTVHLEPKFCDAVSAEFRRNFNLNLSIQVGYRRVTDSSDIRSPTRPDWIFVAPFVMLSGRCRTMPLLIDPSAFLESETSSDLEFNPPSSAHHSCLTFVNADSPQHEPLAHLPITIQLPAVTHLDTDRGVFSFGLSGDFFFTQKVCRWFVRIPRGSTAGVLRIRRIDKNGDSPSIFTISVVQPTSIGSSLGSGNEVICRRINLVAQNTGGVGLTSRNDTPPSYEPSVGEFIFSFPIDWVSETVEITLAQHHGADTPERCQIQGKLDFHGLEVRPEKISFHLPQTYFLIHLRSNFGLESIRFELESKCWIQPIKPTSSARSYKKLDAYEKGFFGLPGLHCLTLTYNFAAPFKSDNVLFDFRRLTSLLYDSDVVQTIYYVYDSYGRFYGCGSYQTIFYADTKKISYLSKESDNLDKLSTYSLLIRWPLGPSGAQSSSSNAPPSSTSSQLTLEVSTSLATLALADVDYEKSCSRLLYNGTSFDEVTNSGDIENAALKDNRRDPIFGNIQKFATVPWHLSAGESITEFFGITDDSLPSYATPGSYFEGRMSYYDNRNLRTSVKLPLEVHAGPGAQPTISPSAVNSRNHAKGAFGLRAKDLLNLRWIANGHFDLDDASRHWISPFELRSMSCSSESIDDSEAFIRDHNAASKYVLSCASMVDITSINTDKSSAQSKETTETELLLRSSLTNIQKILQSVFNPDRMAIWRDVNSAMKDLITSLVKAAEAESLDEPLRFLLPEPIGSAVDKETDLFGPIPALICGESSEKSVEKSSESIGISEVKTIPMKSSSTKDALYRTIVVESLCIYGRCICEQLALAPGSAVAYRQKLAACLQVIISRVQKLLNGSEQPDETDSVRPMKNFFDAEEVTVAAALGLTAPLVERVKPAFELFWLAHLFVLHPQLPLLEALTRLSYQINTPLGKGNSQPLLKNVDPALDKAASDAASVTSPWLIEQLRRMGLSSVARRLERQLPSKFKSFDYNLVLSKPPSAKSLP